MSKITAPYYPIIYVRGYAMTHDEIESTTATPYMGFNLGATKVRQLWDGEVVKRYFESPLIRLMKEYGYRDSYISGKLKVDDLSARTIFIHRYYDQADPAFGEGETPTILDAAGKLRQLIADIRDGICENETDRQRFRVYLVAHSMGGLVCRALLQNTGLRDTREARQVDKVFTYATPHNGIEMAGINVPRFLGLMDLNNFNRKFMADYLSLPDDDDVSSLDGHFEPDRFFCLIGTNHNDYEVARGWSSRLAGEMSDGLVRIKNACVRGAPRAFVHRSHSGPFGIVNSEEGYQNLVRFLFGNVRINGVLEIEHLPLPPSVRRAREQDDQEIRASYYFESTLSPRPNEDDVFLLSERRKTNHSAVLRRYDEMFKPASEGLVAARWPTLFSVFLDTTKIAVGRTLVFTVELCISATDYEIDGVLFFDKTLPGENIYRDTLCIRATAGENGWRIRCNHTDSEWGETRGSEADTHGRRHHIPLSNRKGFKGTLLLEATGHKS